MPPALYSTSGISGGLYAGQLKTIYMIKYEINDSKMAELYHWCNRSLKEMIGL